MRSIRAWQKRKVHIAYSRLHESEALLHDLQAKRKSSEPQTDTRPTAATKWAERVSRFRKQEKEQLAAAQRKGDLSLHELEARIQRLRDQKTESCKAKEKSSEAHRQAVRAQLKRQQASADLEIETQLQKYQQQMEQFQHTHSQILRQRAQSAASKRRSRPASPGGTEDPDVMRLLDFLVKQHNRDQRLQRAKREQEKNYTQQRNRHEARALKAAHNKRECDKLNESKLREIEQRLDTPTQESRRQSVMKESFYRQEQQRTKVSHNRRRLQRIHSARQAQLLHRGLEATRRVQSLQASRLSQREKYEEALHSSLLERDRTYELVERIARSPDAKRAEEVVRELAD